MKSKQLIDRPLVKMCRPTDTNCDLEWYETMMGKQAQIINLLEERINTLTRICDVVEETNKLLMIHRDILQKQLDIFNNKIIIFQPKNIISKKKNNVVN